MAFESVATFQDEAAVARLTARLLDTSGRVRAAAALGLTRLASPTAATIPVGGAAEEVGAELPAWQATATPAAVAERVLDGLCRLVADPDWYWSLFIPC